MGRRLRFIPPGSLVEVTTRTVQGRLLLRPNRLVADLCRGVLARAVRLYPVEVHAFAFLGNHYHLLVTVQDAQRLASFVNYLNSNLAREIGRVVSWRERFWGRRYQAIVVSPEESAQVDRLLYVLRQGTKEGLVRRPSDWPGATSTKALLSGEQIRGLWVDRSSAYRAARATKHFDPYSFRSTESLELTRLPCWRTTPEQVYRKRLRDLVRTVELEAEARIRRSGQRPVGRKGLSRQNPHDVPGTSKRSPAPTIHATSARVRREFRRAYQAFFTAYAQASSTLRSASRPREWLAFFPRNAFPPPEPFLSLS